MSPASYQTAPPRTWMLSTAPRRQQQNDLSALPGWRWRRRRRRASLHQGVRLLDGLLGRVDLGLIDGQVALLKGLLGLLEVLEGQGEQIGHGRPWLSRGWLRGRLSERQVDGVGGELDEHVVGPERSLALPVHLVGEPWRERPPLAVVEERGDVGDVVAGELESLGLEEILRIAEMGHQLGRGPGNRREQVG